MATMAHADMAITLPDRELLVRMSDIALGILTMVTRSYKSDRG